MPKKSKKLRPVSKLPLEFQAQSTWALGKSFETAALELLRLGKAEVIVPAQYLMLHALELYLKAFLFSQGVCDKALRDIGHDLIACLRTCDKYDLAKHLCLPRSAVVQIVRANRYYCDKELEYFAPRAKSFGRIETLADSVAHVGKQLIRPITEDSFRRLSQETMQS